MTAAIKTVLFVDYDSLYLSLRARDPGMARRFASQPNAWIEAIESGLLITPQGDPPARRRILMRRVYADPKLLGKARQAFATQGFAPLQAAYAQRDVLLGQSVGLWSTPGQYPADGHPPTQTGVAQGVDAQGALLVHTEQGVQAWHSGDVSVRPHTA